MARRGDKTTAWLIAASVVGSVVLSPFPVRAHSGSDNPFFRAVAFPSGAKAGNPQFVVNQGAFSASWDNYFSFMPSSPSCNVIGNEDVTMRARALDANGSPASGWRNFKTTRAFNLSGGCGYSPPWREHETYSYNPCSNQWNLCPYHEFQWVGVTSGNLYSYAKTTAQFDPPPQVQNFRATQVAACAITLAWTDTPGEDHYEIQRSDDGVWNEVAQPPQDATSYVDKGLVPSTPYVYRIRAVNSLGASLWSDNVLATTSEPAPCDSDGDGLKDSDERNILGTSPAKADTDGDGLLDPWEVQRDDVEGDGFVLGSFPDLVVASRDEVFGPYVGTACGSADGEFRLSGQVTCLNQPPDPLHKDVFLEMDWQDCTIDPELGGGCPDGDDMHHAPNLDGLAKVIEKFAAAPASNPDGVGGINLRILIDESVAHQPNCDQDVAALRVSNFGTEIQRDSGESASVLAAKELAVRYVWSGHSSHSEGIASCPTPNFAEILATGWGFRSLEPYDWSPYGDANVGGRDILITLGPLWSCPSQVEALGMTQCYRAYSGRDLPLVGPVYQATTWGIFPTHVPGPEGLINLPYPVARLLGLSETQGMTQLWARTFMHVLGHSLGLPTDDDVGNLPDVPGVDSNGDGVNEMRPLDSYSSWNGLLLAPVGEGTAGTELWPRYDVLVGSDLDGDGVVEGDDNCPGVHNPGQSDINFNRWGDACDPDADGDGTAERTTTSTSRQNSQFDPYPLDTDNDGIRNVLDKDDDGDGWIDRLDNCPIARNPLQTNLDADVFGDVCDGDVDGGGAPDGMESALGTDPRDPHDDGDVGIVKGSVVSTSVLMEY